MRYLICPGQYAPKISDEETDQGCKGRSEYVRLNIIQASSV